LEVTILKSGCMEEPNDSAVKALNSTILKNDVMNMGLYDEAVVPLDINMKNIEDSDLWDKISNHLAVLNFCVKTDLHELSRNAKSPLSSVKTNILVRFDLDVNLSSEDALEKQDFNTVYPNVNIDVTSCLCDDAYRCHQKNKILSKNSELQICVMSPNFEKVMVDDIQFSQNGVVKFHPIKDGLTQPMVDNIRNFIPPDNTDAKKSMIVLRTSMIPSFFEDHSPSPISIEGVAKLSTLDNNLDSKLHNKRRAVNDERKANFVMFIDIDTSSTNDGLDNSKIDYKIISAICIVSVILVALAYKARNASFDQKVVDKEEEEDDFVFFDKKNQHCVIEKTHRRKSTGDKKDLSICQLTGTLSIDKQIDTTRIETDDYLDKSVKRHSATELGGHSNIPMEKEHMTEFLTELMLV